MLIIVLVLMLVYKLQVPDKSVRLTRPIPWPYAIITMCYIIFWAALRSGFVDTAAYIRMFQSLPHEISKAFDVFSSDSKNPGWDFAGIVLRSWFTTDFHWWLAIVAVATGIPIMTTLRKKSVDYLYSMFLFITSLTVVWMFNGIRQFLVAAIIFRFYYLIQDQKFIKFTILILLCSTLHFTVWIVFPMYFFVTGKPFGKKMMLFVLAVLTCAISVAPLMDSMEAVLKDTNYAANLEQFAEDDGVHPLRVLLFTVPVILALIKRKTIAAQNNRFIDMCINMSTVAAGLYFVGMFTSGIMIGRLPIYFSLFNLVLIPYLINFVYVRQTKLLYAAFSIGYLIFYYIFASNLYYISDILGTFA